MTHTNDRMHSRLFKQPALLARFPVSLRLSRAAAVPLLLIVLIGLLYIALLFSYARPLNSFWSSDQGFKLIQVKSLLWQKYRSHAMLYPGAPELDPQQEFSPFQGPYVAHEGRVYSMWSAPFAMISGVPFYFFGYAGLYLVPLLSTLLLLWVSVLIGRRLFAGPVWSALLVILLGVASPFFFYSLVFWEHTLAALLTTLALWWALAALQQPQQRRIFWAGVLIGLAAWLRNEAILGAAALGGALLIVRPAAVRCSGPWLAAGTVAGLLPMLLFNWWVYGDIISPHIRVLAPGNYEEPATLAALLHSRLQWADMLLVPLDRPLLLWGLALLVLLGLALKYSPFFLARAAAYSGALLLIAAMGISIALRLSDEYQTALLISFPWLLLCLLPAAPAVLPPPPHTASSESLARLLLWFALLYILLALLLKLPAGGAQWGPRMLLPAIPALACVALYRAGTWFARGSVLPFGAALFISTGSQANSPRWRLEPALACVMTVLLVAAVLCETYGLQRLQYIKQRNHQVVSAAAQSQQPVIVADTWYVTALLGPLFYEQQELYLVDDGAAFDRLLHSLARRGPVELYYVAARPDEIRSGSELWPRLAAAGEPAALPHQITGQGYVFSP